MFTNEIIIYDGEENYKDNRAYLLSQGIFYQSNNPIDLPISVSDRTNQERASAFVYPSLARVQRTTEQGHFFAKGKELFPV